VIILFLARNPLSFTTPTRYVSALCSVVLYTLRKSTVTQSLLIAATVSASLRIWNPRTESTHKYASDMPCSHVKTSRENRCNLRPGTLASEIDKGAVGTYVYPTVKYTCLYWIQHLQICGAQLHDNGKVHQFLQVHLLHWLEALALIGKTSEGILAIISLEALIPVSLYSITKKS
jgi:hypothetical protein